MREIESPGLLASLIRAAAGPIPSLREQECHSAFDAGRNGLASFYSCFRLPADRWAIRGMNWIGAEALADADGFWDEWIEAKLLTVTPGTRPDADSIVDGIRMTAEAYCLRSIRFDPYHNRELGMQMCATINAEIVEFPGCYSRFDQPLRKFLSALLTGTIVCDDDPLLALATECFTVQFDSKKRMMPSKLPGGVSAAPLVAAIMAFAGYAD